MHTRYLSALALAGMAMALAACSRTDAGEQSPGAPVHGIDLSRWQGGAVSFAAARAAGNTFVFVKATQGARGVDPDHAGNVQRARAAGFAVGSYHFYEMADTPDAQFANIRSHVCLQPGDLPPVVDIEGPTRHAWTGLSVNLHRLLSLMEAHYGVRPIVYAGESFASELLPGFADYPLWLAEYRSANAPTLPRDWPRWTFWQYTEAGVVEGIPAKVDFSWFNGTPDEFQRLRAAPSSVLPGQPCPPGLPSGKGRACVHAAACAKESHVHSLDPRLDHDRRTQ